ncbi:hypothetical protein EST55_04400 [Idiomarina sp. 29L]|uniref:hypothetical protein n=1 Tax=Idiomarina sp. 29L TaxID=2508877 RepID=UPI001012AA7A|nr:hypothetical protein [Idiomarina sp. 29L]RXS42998.1 hypothetical protein EST55_04400 [Idiomarina sp. 29L]
MKILLILLVGVFSMGCNSAQSANGSEVDEPVTMADIKAMIGTPKAKTVESCKVLPVGKKACGGPEGYVVYSSETITNEQALLDAIYKYNEKAKEDAKTGISNCQFIPEPKPQLKDGVCWIP